MLETVDESGNKCLWLKEHQPFHLGHCVNLHRLLKSFALYFLCCNVALKIILVECSEAMTVIPGHGQKHSVSIVIMLL